MDIQAALEWVETKRFVQNSSGNDEVLGVLHSYECWECFDVLIEYQLSEGLSKEQSSLYYYQYLEILSLQREDRVAAANLLRDVIPKLHTSYDSFKHEILPRLIEEGDYLAESHFLDAAVSVFEEPCDIEACLERLTMLFEKKLHVSENLEDLYERILELNPSNMKALKFFKQKYILSENWNPAIDILKRILESTRFQEEVFRTSHEMASIFLYHLNQPVAALEVMADHGSGSPLDSSPLLFEANLRLGRKEDCIRLIESNLKKNSYSPREQAGLLFRLGELLIESQEEWKAESAYRQAIEAYPQGLEAFERLIAIRIGQGDWSAVTDLLDQVKNSIDASDLKEQLQIAKDRVQNAVNNK